MTEQEFKTNASGAETFHKLADLPEVDFWGGYLRGIRRHYYGEKFGTADEHATWIKLMSAHGTHDQQCRYRGLGYQCGFAGTDVSDAIEQLQQTHKLSSRHRSPLIG